MYEGKPRKKVNKELAEIVIPKRKIEQKVPKKEVQKLDKMYSISSKEMDEVEKCRKAHKG